MTSQEETRRQQRYNRFGIGAIVVLSGLTLYMWIGVIAPRDIKANKEKAKQSVIDDKVKQYEKTLPYYKEYLQTKEQIAQYRDSLQRVMK